jgi:hypothetical protein
MPKNTSLSEQGHLCFYCIRSMCSSLSASGTLPWILDLDHFEGFQQFIREITVDNDNKTLQSLCN